MVELFRFDIALFLPFLESLCATAGLLDEEQILLPASLTCLQLLGLLN